MATGVSHLLASVSRMSKCTFFYLKAFSYAGYLQLKLGSMPDHCFCFAEGKYLAWCDVALGGQLQDLGKCLFRLGLNSHMTSFMDDGVAQMDVMVVEISL